jgi:fumarate hydratase subunit alpha
LNREVLIENVAVNLLKLAAIRLPQDVKEALGKAYREERSPIGKSQLKIILDNVEVAEETETPMCQDTGLVSFYLKVGSHLGGLERIERILQRAVRRATVEVPLRPNTLDFFTQKNTNDNTGRHIPYIYWKIVSGDFIEVTAFPKGGGSENTCALRMLKPIEGLEGLKKFVVESVVKAGGMPCPPTIVGVGVGGGANIAMELAKMSLLRPINEPNANETAALLERELYEAVNKTGIGPMGLGGDSTTLAVKLEYSHRHPASYPAAVAFQCWAARRATARIHSDDRVEYLTHKMKNAS